MEEGPGVDMGTHHENLESSKQSSLCCTLFVLSVSSICEPRLAELYPEPGYQVICNDTLLHYLKCRGGFFAMTS